MMIRFCATFLIFGVPAFAQSRVDLLRQVAQHYQNADSFEVKGVASALVPRTSWRVSYRFDTEAARPAFLPLNVRTPSMQFVSRVDRPQETLAVLGATDPKPSANFAMPPFGQYNELARKLVDAQKIGTETVTVQGHVYSCEVIDAVYDYSPGFKPQSMIRHKHLTVSPTDLAVLRETDSSSGLDWTAEVTEFSFNHSPSDALVKSLQRFVTLPKDRPEWVDKQVPDFTLPQLSGLPVKLSELHGKPILLDFWGSYCGPCKRTTQHAQDLQKRFGASGLVVLTLTQDTSADAKLWADYNHVTLPVLLDSDGTAFKAFDVQGVPVTIFINENGNVVHYWVGLDDPSLMDSVLSTQLQPRPASATGSEQHE